MIKRAYICHPFAADPQGNRLRVINILESIVHAGYGNVLPIVPWLSLTHFLDDRIPGDRAKAMLYAQQYINTLVPKHDQLWVYGAGVSSGMAMEIAMAKAHGIEIIIRSPTITNAQIAQL
jgi:hypothetical protein